MGRDKALLEWDGEALVERAARCVEGAAGRAAIVGDPDRYQQFGWPVIQDLRPEHGPLAGIEAALASPYAGLWNLVVACDMPKLEPRLLSRLLEEARLRKPDCVTAYTARGPEPLCAVYGRGFLDSARRALDAGERKIQNAYQGLQVIHLWTDSESAVTNVNTPADWNKLGGGA